MARSKQMEEVLEALFPGQAKLKAEHLCPFCKHAIGPFRDELSLREYSISGLCQECQDAVSNSEEE